jgi:hypothetical protein
MNSAIIIDPQTTHLPIIGSASPNYIELFMGSGKSPYLSTKASINRLLSMATVFLHLPYMSFWT